MRILRKKEITILNEEEGNYDIKEEEVSKEKMEEEVSKNKADKLRGLAAEQNSEIKEIEDEQQYQ